MSALDYSPSKLFFLFTPGKVFFTVTDVFIATLPESCEHISSSLWMCLGIILNIVFDFLYNTEKNGERCEHTVSGLVPTLLNKSKQPVLKLTILLWWCSYEVIFWCSPIPTGKDTGGMRSRHDDTCCCCPQLFAPLSWGLFLAPKQMWLIRSQRAAVLSVGCYELQFVLAFLQRAKYEVYHFIYSVI